MILFIARWMQAAWDARPQAWRWAAGATAVVTVANAIVIFGPVLRIPLADRVYFTFYHHAQTYALTKNLDTFGRRPLGFCDTSITIENPLSKRELKDLKERKRLRRQKTKPAPMTAPTTVPATRATTTTFDPAS
jgi:hypothetical protein